MEIRSVAPVFGVNFGVGWSGFTYYDNSFISQGIAWFTRPDLLKPDDTPVSHALTVSGLNECIEARPEGVVRSPLDKYFNDPHAHIFFRCPFGYTERMGQRIVQEVEKHIGDKYDYWLVVADLLANSFLGRIINRITFNLPNWMGSLCLDRNMEEICSELTAMGLQSIPELHALGCLTQPARMITPRMLAFDQQCYVPLAVDK